MRFTLLVLSVLLVAACSSKNAAHEDAGVVTKVGLIKARDDVSMQQVEEERSRVNTRISVGASSGGGVSVGLGFLFSQFGSKSSETDPVRYEVELIDGGQMTIYHDGSDFEIDDCVEITLHPDEEKHPPTMKRNKGGCG